eukprot:scaffold129659_cov20-Tisochrysis_lutea.AAC.1
MKTYHSHALVARLPQHQVLLAAAAAAAVLNLCRWPIRGPQRTRICIWLAQLMMEVVVVVVDFWFGLSVSCWLHIGRRGVNRGRAYELASRPHKLQQKVGSSTQRLALTTSACQHMSAVVCSSHELRLKVEAGTKSKAELSRNNLIHVSRGWQWCADCLNYGQR